MPRPSTSVAMRTAVLPVVLAAFAAGCSKPSTAPTADAAAPSPVAQPVDAGAAEARPEPEPAPKAPADGSTATGAAKPALAVDLTAMGPGEWHATATDLPAVTEDGAKVALFVQKEDGERAYPNHGVVVLKVEDLPDPWPASLASKVDKELTLLAGDEIDKAESAPNASGTTLPAYKKKVEERVAQIHEVLGKDAWQKLPWQSPSSSAMIALESSKAVPLPPLVAGGVQAALADGRLTIKEAVSGKVLVDADAKALSIKPPKPTSGPGTCDLVPYLKQLAADASRRVLVLTVGQRSPSGDTGCFAVARTVAYRWKP